MPTTVSKPILLDETGKDIVEAIADLAGVPSPAVNYLKDASISGSRLILERRDGSTLDYVPQAAGVEWGNISGDLEDQTDLQNVLNAKSTVGVSQTGTSTEEINYITIDGVEKKIAGGAGSWSDLSNKPFTSIDSTTLKVESDVLKVNTTTEAIQDNTQPITGGAVYTIVGNIEALLDTI